MAQKMILAGTKPYVDPRYRRRSYYEAKLIEIMELCWEYERTKRINIFEVVRFLRNAKADAPADKSGLTSTM
jgi:hypothetical protein